MIQPVVPTPVLPVPDDKWKEFVAALLAVAIMAVTLYLLVDSYLLAKEADATAWGRRAQQIQAALALAGTVTGYYFGRIPAERAAASANQAAAANALRANDAIAARNQTIGQVNNLRTVLASSGSPMGGGSGGAFSADEVKAAIAQRLEQIAEGG